MRANAIPLGSQTRELNSKSIARTCEAIDRVRLSRAATRHAIERSRKSLLETQALLVRSATYIQVTRNSAATEEITSAYGSNDAYRLALGKIQGVKVRSILR